MSTKKSSGAGSALLNDALSLTMETTLTTFTPQAESLPGLPCLYHISLFSHHADDLNRPLTLAL